jgi:hypothetical protein
MSRLATLKQHYCTDVAKIINEYCMISKVNIKKTMLKMHAELEMKTTLYKREYYFFQGKLIQGLEILESLETYNWNNHVQTHLARLYEPPIERVSRKHCRYCIIDKINEKKKKNLADIVRLSELKRGLYRENVK